MSVLRQLSLPIIAAPMAGGPSTPELVRAVADAGGLGFLAVGTMNCAEAQQSMSAADGATYGVNLFAPQVHLENMDPVARIAEELAVHIPDIDLTFGWHSKFDCVLRSRAKVASVTFGPFSDDDVARLHERGIEAWMTVTNPDDALVAERAGADAIIVQGPKAGGHRGTWSVEEVPDQRSLSELLEAIDVSIPVVAAGGINSHNIGHFLDKADAVACGSAFLLAEEAGTLPMSREMLLAGAPGSGAGRESVSTRAFSGRFARGLATPFTRAHDEGAGTSVGPTYPYLNAMLAPMRTDPYFAYCLVGEWWDSEPKPAAQIVAELTGGI